MPDPTMQQRLEIAQSNEAFYAKVLFKLRQTLLAVSDHIQDEGDRVYFGSTNHADALKEIAQTIDALKWDKIMESTQPKVDLYELLQTERTAREKAEQEAAAARGEALSDDWTVELQEIARPGHRLTFERTRFSDALACAHEYGDAWRIIRFERRALPESK